MFNYCTCIGPGMQDKTLSMFSEFTSTSFTATRASPGNKTDKSIMKVLHYSIKSNSVLFEKGIWHSNNRKCLFVTFK